MNANTLQAIDDRNLSLAKNILAVMRISEDSDVDTETTITVDEARAFYSGYKSSGLTVAQAEKFTAPFLKHGENADSSMILKAHYDKCMAWARKEDVPTDSKVECVDVISACKLAMTMYEACESMVRREHNARVDADFAKKGAELRAATAERRLNAA